MDPLRVALVTGSGKQRVGASVAEALADRGYHVVLHYHRSEAEAHERAARIRLRGGNALPLQADLADEHSVRALVDSTLRNLNRLDVLVTCAAIWEPKRLEDVTAADVRRHLEVNTVGTFVCCQQAGLAMVRQPEGGCIVTLGDWAIERPYREYSAYFPSKGAIPTLTRCLAVELGTRNPRVRVNCILPGPVMLPEDLPADEKRRTIEATLVRREGRPEHVAQTVLYLVDNEFVTGDCVRVDGGRTIFAAGF